jgi:secreted Zn-dependent insulinase-like peptidase
LSPLCQAKGSILEELMARGLATEAWAGTDQTTTNCLIFSMNLTVTDKGLRAWEEVRG